MNYLAHLYLSGDNDEVQLGNFIGDSVKGCNFERFPDMMRKGIILHRQIDSFTDNHKLYRVSSNRFKSHYHKHSGVITDILYDHFLSKNWHLYSEIPVESYIRNIYVLAVYYHNILPERVKKFLPFMITKNWLGTYSTLEGIESIFERMSKRTSLPAEYEFAMRIINEKYDDLNEEFIIFFDDLISFVNDKFDLGIKKRGM
ncbi:MAG: hypothetical protein A2W91_19035 [Bacteroidetes bacterium GWF2_38_335]|nr:MAG: hypothetical protein A2W91_19035 [Bacteroidetes bacterium GWF2_38_335]OFY80234.1 MAG: hypothetical protein A2281_17160 [Bacteroidetes bacterium RIFOXYA12_FULL_38_20]HBS88739.1 DUF479 domain-containing protein [Bacteroidales bacterium]